MNLLERTLIFNSDVFAGFGLIFLWYQFYTIKKKKIAINRIIALMHIYAETTGL